MIKKPITKQKLLDQLNDIKNRLTDVERSDGTLTLVNNLIAEVTNSSQEEY